MVPAPRPNNKGVDGFGVVGEGQLPIQPLERLDCRDGSGRTSEEPRRKRQSPGKLCKRKIRFSPHQVMSNPLPLVTFLTARGYPSASAAEQNSVKL